jgi:hypothetical protein
MMNSVNGIHKDQGSRAGSQSLTYNVHVFEDHSVVVVTRHDHIPLRGDSLRVGHFRVGIGREHLAGLSSPNAVRLVSWGIVVALSDTLPFSDPGVAPGAPEGATGGVVNIPLPGL